MARPKGRGGSEQQGSGQAGDARARVEHRDTSALHPHIPRGGDLIAKFLYAITVTVIVVFATIRLGRLAEQAKERECWIACGSRLAV
jgi:hypothetical protein